MERDLKTGGVAEALIDFEKRWTGAYLEGLTSYWGIMADLARSPSSLAAKAPTAYGRLMDAGVRYYKTVLEAGSDLSTRLYDSTPKPEPAQEPKTVAAKPLSEMSLEGVEGSKPATRFLIANKTAGSVDVTFEVSELTSNEGERLRLNFEMTPASFTLQPGEESVVECRVPIDSAMVEEREYRAILRAIGLPDMRAILCVRRLGG